MSVRYRNGFGWCGVVHTIHGFRLVHSIPSAVEIGWGDVWVTRPVPVAQMLYLNGASNLAGQVAAIGVGHNDHAYLVTETGAIDSRGAAAWDLGKAYRPTLSQRRAGVVGQNPVGLYWRNSWVPVIQRSARTYTVGDLEVTFPFSDGTSQGFRDVQPDGTIIFGDDADVITLGGVVLHKPVSRGSLTVGQIDPSDRIDGVYGFGKHFTAIPDRAYEPKCAWDNDSEWAICARAVDRAAYLTVPPYPPLVVDVPPVKPDPPDPKPPDPKEPPVALDYDFGPVQRHADTRWAQLPHGTRLEHQQALFRIAYEWWEQGHRETQVFRKGKTDTTFQAADGFSYAEDIWVLNLPSGKWQADVGERFGGEGAKINFNKAWAPPNGNDAAMCVAPPKPGGVVPEPQPEPDPQEPPVPTEGRPASLHAWIHEEYPQLVAAYEKRRGDTPGHEWAAFQTYRRYVEGWSLARMLEHERSA